MGPLSTDFGRWPGGFDAGKYGDYIVGLVGLVGIVSCVDEQAFSLGERALTLSEILLLLGLCQDASITVLLSLSPLEIFSALVRRQIFGAGGGGSLECDVI